MERRIIFIIILFFIFSSCRNSKDENFTQNIKIDVANYSHEEYNRNVKRFVDSLHLNYKDSLDVIFLNSGNCSTCILNLIDSILPPINTTKKKTIVFVNDQKIEKEIKTKIKNQLVIFVYFDVDKYTSLYVYHSNPTIYHFKDNILLNSNIIH